MSNEPLLHSHIEDILPDDHPLATTTVYCVQCRAMLHAVNNECMQTWVESGSGNYCLQCFSLVGGKVLNTSFAVNAT